MIKKLITIITLLTILACSDIGKNFQAIVIMSPENPIKEVTIIVGDVETRFSDFNEYSERRIYIPVPQESGTFDMLVKFINGKEQSLSEKEYRSGYGVYLAVRESGITYTKAHW